MTQEESINKAKEIERLICPCGREVTAKDNLLELAVMIHYQVKCYLCQGIKWRSLNDRQNYQ